MNLIEEFLIFLSKKNRRYIYLLLSIIIYFYILSVLYSIAYSIEINNNNIEILNFKDIFELFIIFLTLVVLFIRTNKTEINRYKENVFFYIEKYFKYFNQNNEINYFLKLNKKNNDNIYSSSIDYFKLKNIKITKNIYLNDIELKLNDCEHELPFLIEEKARWILIEKFNIQAKTDYNSLTLALRNVKYDKNNNKLTFTFCKSCYFKHLLTNMIPEYEIIPNLTVRDIIETTNTGELHDLSVSKAANHLGINALISINVKLKNTYKKYFIIPKRSAHTLVFKSQLSPSVSGASNILSCYDNINDNYNIHTYFKNELKGELETFFNSFDQNLINHFTEQFLKNALFIGMSRELKRLGKPEIFFYFDYQRTFLYEEIVKNKYINIIDNENLDYIKNINNTNFDIKNLFQEKQILIDYEENEQYFLIEKELLLNNIEFKEIKTKNRKDSYIKKGDKDEKITEISCNFHNNKFKISETLFVNLIFYLQYSSYQK